MAADPNKPRRAPGRPKKTPELAAAHTVVQTIANTAIQNKLKRTLITDPRVTAMLKKSNPEVYAQPPTSAHVPSNNHSKYLTARIHHAFLTDDDLAEQIWMTLRSIATDRDHPMVLRAIEIILDRTEGRLSSTVNKNVQAETRTTIVVDGATKAEMESIQRGFGVVDVPAEVTPTDEEG